MQSTSRVPASWHYALAVVATAAATGVRQLLTPWLGSEAPLLLFGVSILITASIGGFGPGLLATLLGALAGDFFFIAPRMSLWIDRGTDLARVGVLLASGIVISWLSQALKQSRHRAAASVRRAAELSAQARAEALARESASAALQDTRTDFLAVFDYAAVGMTQADPHSGRLLKVNQKLCDMTGYSEEELLGMTIADLTHSADREQDQAALRQVVDGNGTEYAAEKRYARKDGSVMWAHVSARIVRSSSGKPRMIFSVVIDLTERKRAERELQERESQLRQIGDNLSQGFLYQLVAEASGQRRFVFVSAGVERITGVSAREALADPNALYSVIHPDDLPRIAAIEMECLRDGFAFDVVARARHRVTGEARWAHMRSAPRRLPDGAVVWDGIFLDVTAAKRTEEALARSMERLDLAQRAGGIGVFDWEVQTGALVWNDEEHRIFGLPNGSAATHIDQWRERVHPDDLPRMQTELSSAMERRDSEMQFAFRILRPDGTARFIEGAGRFFYDAETRPVRMVGVNLDVTERREAQTRIEDSEAHLRAVVDAATASGLGIARSDAKGKLLDANDAFFRITGLRRGELPAAGLPWLALDGCEQSGDGLAEPKQEAAAGHPLAFETECTRSDGQRVPLLLSGSCTPIATDEFIWFVNDLSAQKKAEIELRQAKDVAEAASRAKDHFLATLSHELRTPLAPVVPLVQHLAELGNLPPEVRADLCMIRRNIALETRLIDDLLDLTRVAKGKMDLRFELVDLHPLLERTRVICAPEDGSSRSVRVELELNAQHDAVWGDPVRLQQVFWNLLNNACKFSEENGVITVRTSMPDAEHVRIDVQDRGRGISADLMARLFTPFEQGERHFAQERRGLGLGLAISKALVESHQGRISVFSAGVGKGATFEVTLPACTGAEAISARANQPPVVKRSRSSVKRILLVEDHADTGVIMERLLKVRGYIVKRVSTKAGAISAGSEGTFDIVVSDIGLPDGTGHEVMEALRLRGPVRGIALSGFGTEEDARRSREAGFIEHLVKPVDFERLVEVIEWAEEAAEEPGLPA